MKNAISIDLEDWFCVHNLSRLIKKEDWDGCESRISKNTECILEILQEHKTQATFFVLGWIAEKFPELIYKIEQNGHEIATHGYHHLNIIQTTPREFEEDLKKSLDILKKIGIKQDVLGFRAPSFTIVEKTMWALEILEKYNLKYDSSIFPIGFHPTYGVPSALLSPYKVSSKLQEFPMSCVRFFGVNFRCCGGAYFRFFPYTYTRYCIKKCNSLGRPIVFYIHPWEIDPDQPKLKLPALKYLRHYYNLDKTKKRLDKLLSDFQFTTIRNVLGL